MSDSLSAERNCSVEQPQRRGNFRASEWNCTDCGGDREELTENDMNGWSDREGMSGKCQSIIRTKEPAPVTSINDVLDGT